VFVLPSYSENFGIAVAEAMAAGLPVIVSDQVAIHCEVSRARAGVVVRCNVGELAEALVLLLADGTLRRAMGQKGREMARETYSLSAVSRKVIGFYNQIAH
jgi:glycosyltransferase involved in cell wall biosynthesis